MPDEVKEEVKQSEEAPKEAKPSEAPAAEEKQAGSKPEKSKKAEKVAVPKEFEKLVGELDKLSALEISKFVKFLEEHWGVSAAAPAVPVAAAPAGRRPAPPAQ